MYLTSWRSPENPAPSLFSLELDPNGNSIILLWNGSKLYSTSGSWNSTSGSWNGDHFSSDPDVSALYCYIPEVKYISNANVSYFTYDYAFPYDLPRYVLDVSGQLKRFVSGMEDPMGWTRCPPQQCEVYDFCGAFSACNELRPPPCSCLQGFEPRVPKDWELEDHTNGCVRKTPLQCDKGGNDTFSLMPNTRLPSNSESLTVANVEECKLACVSNCSCTAYAYDKGCLIWKGNLFSLTQLPSGDSGGRDFHVRIAASELLSEAKTKSKTSTAWIVLGTVGGFSTSVAIVLLTIRRRRQTVSTLGTVEDSLMLFKYRDIRSATKNFSKKLGEGGFGTVYKGTLPNSTAIAVKRLKNLNQGEKQFRAEVSTIGMIQHINLVRLQGFCIKGTNRFLVYDYMINGSLESHLFRKAPNVLDWKTRLKIAIGAAKGLAYLHEKCRDCILHLDIKPDNILLDAEFNPKVADFGLAKLISRDFSRVLTTMRGTIGYLAPEWISGEAITPKADVFSYGMLLFEIISGRRNRDLLDDGTDVYFPARAASRVNEGEELLTLLDKRLEGNADAGELTRVCKVACWCIQDEEKDRPTMGNVVHILEGVSEVGMPPIPRFLQGFAKDSMEPLAFQVMYSSSTLQASISDAASI